MADVISNRLFEQMDLGISYPNAITSTLLTTVKIPLIVANDKEVFQLLIRTCNDIDYEKVKIVRIKNTLALDTIQVSEALLPEVAKTPGLELLSQPSELRFNEQNNLW
jgi:hypothetical protein